MTMTRLSGGQGPLTDLEGKTRVTRKATWRMGNGLKQALQMSRGLDEDIYEECSLRRKGRRGNGIKWVGKAGRERGRRLQGKSD